HAPYPARATRPCACGGEELAMPKPPLVQASKRPSLSPAPPPRHEQHHTDQPKRDHHGDRRVPPPATFDLYALPDSTLLSEREIAALLRVAVSTVQTWRQRGHPLSWVHIGQGRVRYRRWRSPRVPRQRSTAALLPRDEGGRRAAGATPRQPGV